MNRSLRFAALVAVAVILLPGSTARWYKTDPDEDYLLSGVMPQQRLAARMRLHQISYMHLKLDDGTIPQHEEEGPEGGLTSASAELPRDPMVQLVMDDEGEEAGAGTLPFVTAQPAALFGEVQAGQQGGSSGVAAAAVEGLAGAQTQAASVAGAPRLFKGDELAGLAAAYLAEDKEEAAGALAMAEQVAGAEAAQRSSGGRGGSQPAAALAPSMEAATDMGAAQE